MRLDRYLEALKNCPDEMIEGKGWRITKEFGVYDNWPIFLSVKFEEFVEHLKSGNYLEGEDRSEMEIIKQFFYKPGTVELQVMNYISPSMTTGLGGNLDEEDKKHSEKQMKEYNVGILLHPYQKNKMEGVIWTRAIALVIQDIGDYALQNNIGLCFPNSRGWDYTKDYSRIVYSPDDRSFN